MFRTREPSFCKKSTLLSEAQNSYNKQITNDFMFTIIYSAWDKVTITLFKIDDDCRHDHVHVPVGGKSRSSEEVLLH